MLLLTACEPTSTPADFTGGDFQFRTLSVDDACLDGGMEVLFMPEGEPTDFSDPVYLPGADELPMTYTVSLQAPFTDMEITVTGDQGARTVTGAENLGVEFDADNYPGCLVNTSIDVDLVIDSADEVHGTATLSTSSFDESSCPVPDSDPCTIVATLEADRVQ